MILAALWLLLLIASLGGIGIGAFIGKNLGQTFFTVTSIAVLLVLPLGGLFIGVLAGVAVFDTAVIATSGLGNEPSFWGVWLPVALITFAIAVSAYLARVWTARFLDN